MLVGTGRCAINPEPGHPLAGYGPDYFNTGVHDDIHITAFYFDDGETKAILMNFDLVGLLRPQVTVIREEVAKAVGIDKDNVFTTCTHTHSGPSARMYNTRTGEKKDTYREDYNAKLPGKAVEAAKEAVADAEECTVHYNFTNETWNMNRRFHLRDRQALYIPNYKQLVGGSCEYVDNEIGILIFKRIDTSNGYKAIISNYTAHPLCVGNSSLKVSADFQGQICKIVEETFESCMCMATTGAAGDNHPLKPESGFEFMREMGSALGRTIIERAYDAVEIDYDTKLRTAYKTITLKTRDKATSAVLPEAEDRDFVHEKETIETDISLLGIGPILFGGIPGEPVSELGMQFKWGAPFLKSFVLFQATDAIGYIPTANQMYWGGYEAVTCQIAHGEGERMIEEMTGAAFELIKEAPLNMRPVGDEEVGYGR